MIHRSAATAAPVKIVLISAANCSGKTFVLRCLSRDHSFRGVITFEMDSLAYWIPERLAAGLAEARKTFETWRVAQPPSALLAEMVDDVRTSPDDHQLFKMKLVELSRDTAPLITVNPQSMRHDVAATRFLRLLEEYRAVRIRHVLLHPTLPLYRRNLERRGRIGDADPGVFEERALLYARRSDFDAVLRMTRLSGERTVARFFLRQLR